MEDFNYFENEKFSDEEKMNTAFQVVTGMRDVLNIALKSSYIPTYETALAYIEDISPQLYNSIINHLPDKNESDLVRRFREQAEADFGEDEELNEKMVNAKAVLIILKEIDKCDTTIQKNSITSKDVTANRSFKRQLNKALKSFQTRNLSEHELLNHDFSIENRSGFRLIDSEFDRKDYRLPNGNILRMYLAHPNKIEHVLGVDVIYEVYDLRLQLVRFAQLQYKTWKALTLSFDEREDRQLQRLRNNTCDCNHCEIPKAYASTNPFRFPYCSAFVRPTNKVLAKGSKMKTMGDHVPLCKLNELRINDNQILKKSIQDISLTQNGFEEGFNKFHVGSRWMPINDLENFYKKRKLTDMVDNIRIIVQEVEFGDELEV